MKIGIDIQGCQSDGSKSRGIGRYSLTLIRYLIKHSQSNDEFILIANKSLDSVDKEFLSYISSFGSKVQYFEWIYPGCTASMSNSHADKTAIAEQLRSYSFCLLNCDIILMTSFFEGFRDNCVIEFDNNFDLPPIASIFYDLIPLLKPEIYLDSNKDFKEFYLTRLDYLNNVSSLLSISKSSSREAEKYLSIGKCNIYNIYAGCDQNIFYPSNLNKNKYNLGKYILYSGAGDPRKNLHRLIEAYSLLSKEIIWNYKLVLVGKLLPEEISLIKSWITSLNLTANQVVLLGYVSDQELASLYRSCALFVFPSLHEGFGLPALEAMSCGAVVLGSNSTSIPEVIQNEKALFDPENVNQISELISKALTNQEFFNEISSDLINRSSKFTWDDTALNALNALRSTILKSKKISLKFEDITSILSFKQKQYQLMIKNIVTILDSNKNLSNDEEYLENLATSISYCELKAKYLKQFKIDNLDALTWRIEGPFDSNYSLAILNRELSLALKKRIPNLSILSTEGPGNYSPDIDFLKKYSSLYQLYKDSLKVNLKNPIVVSRNLYPPRVNDIDSRVNILHAYGWEESEIPSEWIEDFNLYLDGITVMSTQVKKTLIDCGFYKPISICGLGIEHISKSPASTNLELSAKNFKFLHISSCFPRKGIQALLLAYGKAFTIKDDVSLIIKTFKNPHNKLHDLLKEFKEKNSNYPHVLVIDDDYSISEVKSLFKISNVYVAPSHGEGFGLPIAEAMSNSVPVITTSWGGQLDFVTEKNSWLIDFKFAYSDSHFEQYNSVWAAPSSDHLAQQMKFLRNANPSDIKNKTKIAFDDINRNYSWEKTADINVKFVKKLLDYNDINQIKLGVISTWNVKCGIANYTSSLLQNIEYESFIFAPFSDSLLKDDQPNTFRCWELNKPFTDEIRNNILKYKITTIIIEFNYGFFDFSSFNNLINFLSENNILIIIQMHSTFDPVCSTKKSLKTIKKSLILANRILVHTCSDLNRLKNLNIINNVSIFPHGVLDFNIIREYSSNSFSLKNVFNIKQKKYNFATTGYSLPNKGFLELVKSISILVNKKVDIHFTFFTPSYDTNYDFYSKQISDLIQELDLEDHILIDSQYYDDYTILGFLSKMDAVVYPYQISNESSSASVRQGIASGSKVIVTPISIFEDIIDVVDVLPGTSPSNMAQGIIEWIKRNQNIRSSDYKNDQKSLLNKWRKSHLFSILSIRLSRLITALEVDKKFSL